MSMCMCFFLFPFRFRNFLACRTKRARNKITFCALVKPARQPTGRSVGRMDWHIFACNGLTQESGAHIFILNRDNMKGFFMILNHIKRIICSARKCCMPDGMDRRRRRRRHLHRVIGVPLAIQAKTYHDITRNEIKQFFHAIFFFSFSVSLIST